MLNNVQKTALKNSFSMKANKNIYNQGANAVHGKVNHITWKNELLFDPSEG